MNGILNQCYRCSGYIKCSFLERLYSYPSSLSFGCNCTYTLISRIKTSTKTVSLPGQKAKLNLQWIIQFIGLETLIACVFNSFTT